MKKVFLSLALMMGLGSFAHAEEVPAAKTEQNYNSLLESLCTLAESEAKDVTESGLKSNLTIKAFSASCFLVAPQVGRYDLLVYNRDENMTVSEISILVIWTGEKWQTVKVGKTLVLDMKTLGFTFYPKEL